MKFRVAIPLLAAICLASPLVASGADEAEEQRRRDRGGDRGRDHNRGYRLGPRVRIAVPSRPLINVNIGNRGPRYFGPSYYDRWARNYFRWSPISYAPWALITFGAYGTYGAYGAYGGAYGAPYAHAPYAPYPQYAPGYGYDFGGIRLRIRPRDAQVFIDGHYAGVVDDFDGTFQQLRLEGGGHKIEIRMPGFEDLEMDIHVQPGRTITLHDDLKPRP